MIKTPWDATIASENVSEITKEEAVVYAEVYRQGYHAALESEAVQAAIDVLKLYPNSPHLVKVLESLEQARKEAGNGSE